MDPYLKPDPREPRRARGRQEPPERGQAGVYQQVERVTGVSVQEIQRKVAAGVKSKGEFEPVIIKGDIDEDVELALRELEPVTPGLKLLTEPTREYLAGPLLSHVLGYVGPLSAEEYQQL